MKKMYLKKEKIYTFVGVVAGFVIILLNFFLFSNQSQVSSLLNLLAIIIIVGTPLFYKYKEYLKIKKIENNFPKLLSDLTENMNTGMTLPQAMKSVSKNDYGPMTPYVKEMNAKISFGIPFEKVLMNFAEKIGSKSIKRNVQMIIETHRSGGTVVTVLKMVNESLHELENVKKERASTIHAQMINGYLIYFIFLGVMIGLSNFLIPTFQQGLSVNTTMSFSDIFRNLIVIEGVFAGLAIGKLAEGNFTAGIKHSFILTVIGFLIFTLFV